MDRGRVERIAGGPSLKGLVGLPLEKERARIDIAACIKTGEVFPHTLLEGVGGTGKTALGKAIGVELGYYVDVIEASALKTRKQIISRLVGSTKEATRHGKRLLLFLDEAHRLSLPQQESFYYPMDKDDPYITTSDGDIHFPKFCLMAATTRRDMLDQASFVTRFDNVWRIKRYEEHWISEILLDWFVAHGMQIFTSELLMIARRCLGIPRQAIRLARKIRNYVLARGNEKRVTSADCEYVFRLEQIDAIGLTELHVRYLEELLGSGDRAVGARALAGKLGQHPDDIIGTVEPVLLSLDFIDLTASGRILKRLGGDHLRKHHPNIFV